MVIRDKKTPTSTNIARGLPLISPYNNTELRTHHTITQYNVLNDSHFPYSIIIPENSHG